MRNAYRFKVSNYGIHEQFPKAVEDKRRELYPIMRDMKNVHGAKNVKLVRDQLYVNGQVYNPHIHGDRAPQRSETQDQVNRPSSRNNERDQSVTQRRQAPTPMDHAPTD